MDKSVSDPGLRNNSESAEQLNNEQITQLGRSEEVEDLTVSTFSYNRGTTSGFLPRLRSIFISPIPSYSILRTVIGFKKRISPLDYSRVKTLENI